MLCTANIANAELYQGGLVSFFSSVLSQPLEIALSIMKVPTCFNSGHIASIWFHSRRRMIIFSAECLSLLNNVDIDASLNVLPDSLYRYEILAKITCR